MKISGWLIIAVVVIWFLFFYKPKKKEDTGSAATNTPLGNLKSNIAGSTSAANLVAQVVDAAQGRTAADLYDSAPIAQSQVSQGDFIKVTPIENILTATSGEKRRNQLKADRAWWPQVMHDEVPAWNKTELVAAGDGSGDIVLIIKS